MRGIVRIFLLLIGLSLALLLCSCEAPRDNPLDPGATNYIGPEASVGSVKGRVTGLDYTPLMSALVLTIPGYRGAQTNSQGDYLIEDIQAGQYQIFCAPPGYAPDTLQVTVLPMMQTIADFRLDALPVFQSFQVTSHYIYQGTEASPPEYYNIFARARLTDPDGINDIAQVTLEVEDWPDTTMSFNSDSTVGAEAFYYVNLEFTPGASLDSIKWQHFTCVAEDASNNTASTSPLTVLRFFDDYPVPLSPIDRVQEFTPTPVFEWEPFGEQFYFTYEVRVYREQSGSLSWLESALPPSASSIVSDSLASGFYYWLLEAFDEYGNSARSAPAYFEVYLD